MEPFIGQIIMFAGSFAPRGWALCNGQLLDIASHSALFSILGTTYGGDGKSTFGLPDLRGRVAIHEGTGPGLTPRTLGQRGGEETVTLTQNQMPSHSHSLNAFDGGADLNVPTGHSLAQGAVYNERAPDVEMAGASIGNAGSGQPHDNMQPFLAVNFIIALVGTYPSRD